MGLTMVSEKISRILSRSKFTHSVEVFPPRNGRSPELILNKLEKLSRLPIDFISVTKGAMGSMRGGTVPIGYMISERYRMNALVHFRCLDMNKREVENLLVDHIYFGTKNILAILGDPVQGEPEAPPASMMYNRYASELVKQVSDMNSGRYLPLPDEPDTQRKGVSTDFCIGVACYPEAEDAEKESYIMGEKVGAGADFGITQMIFSSDAYGNYMDQLKEDGISLPIIPGIRPVTRMEHVEVAERVFGAKVPEVLKEKLKNASGDAARQMCLDFTVRLCDDLKGAGAPGVHMFILNDVEMARDVLSRVKGS